MDIFTLLIILIILIIIVKLIVEYNIDNFDNSSNNLIDLKISINDLQYRDKFHNSKKINGLINNNKLPSMIKKKNRILFITFDNRKNQEYLKIHNSNLNEYVKKFKYEYKYYSYCDKNVYWCKIYLVLEALKTNNYDYVVWLDSDTIIKNFNIDIGDIFNMFSSDIFVGSDNHTKLDIINSGIFAIANSQKGMEYLSDCINYINSDCLNQDGTLKGKWAASCYEQGVMNILIYDKYYLYTTVLTNRIFFNYSVCSDDVFIMHLYDSKPNLRVNCFQEKKINTDK